jgi:hypothetical protein
MEKGEKVACLPNDKISFNPKGQSIQTSGRIPFFPPKDSDRLKLESKNDQLLTYSFSCGVARAGRTGRS